jgi:hypothetical protein
MPRLTDPPEDAMAYLGSVPVEKFLEGISRFQKDVYPQHQDLFEKLAMGQRPEALFITCADSRIDSLRVMTLTDSFRSEDRLG